MFPLYLEKFTSGDKSLLFVSSIVKFYKDFLFVNLKKKPLD